MWPMGLLFIKTSLVKQYSYQNDLSGVFDALHQSFLVISVPDPVSISDRMGIHHATLTIRVCMDCNMSNV